MPDVAMPRLSDSMEEGTVLKWLVEPGTVVSRGQEIVEIETDKATTIYEADADGPFEPTAAEGDTVAVGHPIATIGGDSAPSHATREPALAVAAVVVEPASAPVPAAAPPRGRPKASPLARRVAHARGIDLAALPGSGPGGRILRADVDAAVTGALYAIASPAPLPDGAKGATTIEELTRQQQVVARRMAESRTTVPEFELTTQIDMAQAVALRAALKTAASEGAPVPSYNDMVVKACALALRDVPRANGAYRDGTFELYGRVNVGVAVAVADALVVPVVPDADTRSLSDIAATTRRLAERARRGELTPPELAGGTFTVSNLGMYGVTSFSAVINAPQSAILAVGSMEPRAVVRDGEVVARTTVFVTLACDHRILYGADAAQLLARVRALLEAPLSLLL